MTDRQTDGRTDGRTDARGKTICLPTLSGGDIISYKDKAHTIMIQTLMKNFSFMKMLAMKICIYLWGFEWAEL